MGRPRRRSRGEKGSGCPAGRPHASYRYRPSHDAGGARIVSFRPGKRRSRAAFTPKSHTDRANRKTHVTWAPLFAGELSMRTVLRSCLLAVAAVAAGCGDTAMTEADLSVSPDL